MCVKSAIAHIVSQISTLSQSKEPNPQQAEQGHAKYSRVYSERGVLLPVLTSGGEWVGVRACKNATRVPPSLCNATQTSDPANPLPCACRTRLRDVCSTRPIRTVGPEPLHPHVCGPHVALEVGDDAKFWSLSRSAAWRAAQGQSAQSPQAHHQTPSTGRVVGGPRRGFISQAQAA
jgi:hypothetical protein